MTRQEKDSLPQSEAVESWLSRGRWAAGGLLLLAVVCTAVAFRYLPTNDGPQHVYVGHVSQQILAGDRFYAELYAPGRALSPLGFDFLFSMLEAVATWRNALRAALGIILAVWASGAFMLSGVVRPERRIAGFIGIVLALQWALYMGFFSYILGCGLAWWGVYALLRADLERWTHQLGLALLLLVASVAHTFGGLLLVGVSLVCAIVLPDGRRAKLRVLGMSLLAALPALGVWLYSTSSLQAVSSIGEYRLATNVWLSAGDSLTLASSGFVSGGWARKAIIGALALTGIGLAVHSAVRRRTSKKEVVLLLMAVGAIVAYFGMPLHMRAWELVSPRFLPIAVIASLPLLPLERLRKPAWSLAAAGLAFVLAGAFLLESWRFHEALVRGCAPALAPLESGRIARGMRLPVFADTSCGLPLQWQDSPVPFVQPLMNAGQLYAVGQGGAVPGTFTVIPQIHVLVKTDAYWQKMPAAPNRRRYLPNLMLLPPGAPRRNRTIEVLVQAGRAFDDVMVYAAPDLADALLRAGYQVRWREGRVTSFGYLDKASLGERRGDVKGKGSPLPGR